MNLNIYPAHWLMMIKQQPQLNRSHIGEKTHSTRFVLARADWTSKQKQQKKMHHNKIWMHTQLKWRGYNNGYKFVSVVVVAVIHSFFFVWIKHSFRVCVIVFISCSFTCAERMCVLALKWLHSGLVRRLRFFFCYTVSGRSQMPQCTRDVFSCMMWFFFVIFLFFSRVLLRLLYSTVDASFHCFFLLFHSFHWKFVFNTFFFSLRVS